MDTTTLLKASINYERNKRERVRKDLTNLLNHSEDNLLLVIDAIEHQMREYEHDVRIREQVIEASEDLSDQISKNLNESIAWYRDRIQSLIAWRAIVFTAIEKVKE